MLPTDKAHKANNFDFIRLIAALLVIEGHAFALTNANITEPFARVVKSTYSGEVAVEIFFLISGYLITKSYIETNNLAKYLCGRILRIIPGLVICSLVTVFIIIPLVFHLKNALPDNYFRQKSTYDYFTTMLLYPLKYSIDGIAFSRGAFGNVINGSLWTLSYEFSCYLLVALLGVISLLRKEVILLIFITTFIVSICKFPANFIVFPHQDFEHLSFFIATFCAGALFYFFHNQIKYTILYTIFCLLMLAYFGYTGKYFNLAFIVFGSYLLFGFAFKVKIGLNNFARYGDASYGVYIYGFLLQQIIVYCHNGSMSPYTNMSITFPVVIVLGYLSWHFAEKPAIQLKRRLF